MEQPTFSVNSVWYISVLTEQAEWDLLSNTALLALLCVTSYDLVRFGHI